MDTETSAPSESDEEPTPRKRGRPSSLLAQVRQCAHCGTDFETKVDPKSGLVARGHKTTYCSRPCALAVNNRSGTAAPKARAPKIRDRYEDDPIICPCGSPIPYEYRFNRKYCSPVCRALYSSPGRQRDPSNYVTFNCETCDVEVTRYKGYGSGANMFCSNICASRHTKKVHHVVVDGLVFDSSWEAFVWGACKVMKMPVKRVDRETHGVEFDDGHFYAPDLYLPFHEVYIEIKGRQDDRSRERQEKFRAAGHKLLVLDWWMLSNLSPRSLQEMVDKAAGRLPEPLSPEDLQILASRIQGPRS